MELICPKCGTKRIYDRGRSEVIRSRGPKRYRVRSKVKCVNPECDKRYAPGSNQIRI